MATGELEEVDERVVCAVQIETEGALRAVDEIGEIDGVDVLFVGPADLGHALGIRGGPDHPELLAQAHRVAEAARNSGKAAGMLVGTPEQVALYRDLGFTFLACSSDSGLLMQEAKILTAALRML